MGELGDIFPDVKRDVRQQLRGQVKVWSPGHLVDQGAGSARAWSQPQRTQPFSANQCGCARVLRALESRLFFEASGSNTLIQPPSPSCPGQGLEPSVNLLGAGTKRRDLPTPSQRSNDAGGPP